MRLEKLFRKILSHVFIIAFVDVSANDTRWIDLTFESGESNEKDRQWVRRKLRKHGYNFVEAGKKNRFGELVVTFTHIEKRPTRKQTIKMLLEAWYQDQGDIYKSPFKINTLGKHSFEMTLPYREAVGIYAKEFEHDYRFVKAFIAAKRGENSFDTSYHSQPNIENGVASYVFTLKKVGKWSKQ